MARNLYLSKEDLALLARMRAINGTIKLPSDERKAYLYFTPIAWTKMYSLVDAFNKEVQWHGVVYRKAENIFVVKDILIFPHTASSVTVVSDQEEYEEWMDQLDDEVFNACRLHGHSHVHMPTTPSSVDMEYRRGIFENFSTNPAADEDQFYIFIIVNKRKEFCGQIYDIANNALYEKKDITIEILEDEDKTIEDFVKKAKELVRDPAPVVTPKASTATAGCGTPLKQSETTKTTIYPSVKHESEDEWRERMYGGGKYDSADKEYKQYPANGFKGGTYLK